MAYSFCLRFLRSPTDTVQTDESEFFLTDASAPRPLRMYNPELGRAILNASQLVLTGDGYASEGEAQSAGGKYQAALMVTLARHRIGADFGWRTPKSGFTDCGLKMLQQAFGQRVLNNMRGLTVFATESQPKFASIDAAYVRGVDPKNISSSFWAAAAAKPELSGREAVAFSCFNASFFRQSADSRLLLLMMAIEALIQRRQRPDKTLAHVNFLISQTQAAELSQGERQSLIGALKELSKESISQAGRSMSIERLGGRVYMNKPSHQFFTYCYSLRSRLVHGSIPYPLRDEVANAVGHLEVFVSDLLTVRFLGLSEQAVD